MSKFIALALLVLLALMYLSGGESAEPPLPGLIAAYKEVPTYSIILQDMKTEGNFFEDFYQKFKIILPKTAAAAPEPPAGKIEKDSYTSPAVESRLTDWIEVPKQWYADNEPFLGMTIYSQKDGVAQKSAGPPGYEYVGDPRYGQWTQDSQGNRVWSFFGQYAMLSMLLGNRGVNQRYYRDYHSYRNRGRVYYGPADATGRPRYGTQGTVTRTQNPSFYTRRMAASRAGSSSFRQSVSGRTGRSQVSVRGRSGRVGK